MQAAVPQYMRDMSQSAPGHRFGLYFPVWSDRWEIIKDKKTDAADKVLSLLEAHGSWIPEFAGSNKIKKKKHERTLKVMRYLPGNES